jgi:hypothetical protein
MPFLQSGRSKPGGVAVERLAHRGEYPMPRFVIPLYVWLCLGAGAIPVPGASAADKTEGDSSASGECGRTIARLEAGELEHYGIRLRADEAEAGGHRIDVSLQPSVCIRAGEGGCGAATYRFAGAALNIEGTVKTLDSKKPNDYKHTLSFRGDDKTLRSGALHLTYRGGRCTKKRFKTHTFIIDLKDASESGPYFF